MTGSVPAAWFKKNGALYMGPRSYLTQVLLRDQL